MCFFLEQKGTLLPEYTGTLWKKDLHQSLPFFNIFLLNLWLLFLINPALTIKPHKGDWHLSSPHRHCWITPKGHENKGNYQEAPDGWTYSSCQYNRKFIDNIMENMHVLRCVDMRRKASPAWTNGYRDLGPRDSKYSIHEPFSWVTRIKIEISYLFYLDSLAEISLRNCAELLAPSPYGEMIKFVSLTNPVSFAGLIRTDPDWKLSSISVEYLSSRESFLFANC